MAEEATAPAPLQLHMLTTVDNPFNPFTDYDEWNRWDIDMGYHTTAYLARVTRSSDELSDYDQDLALEYAVEEIVRENVLGIYRKVPQPAETQAA